MLYCTCLMPILCTSLFTRSNYFLCQGQGGSGPFDDADDCTVPSTPTLYEPKRSDGFAEAVRYDAITKLINFDFMLGSSRIGRCNGGL